MKRVVWFRDDLRVDDHAPLRAALAARAKDGQAIVGLVAAPAVVPSSPAEDAERFADAATETERFPWPAGLTVGAGRRRRIAATSTRARETLAALEHLTAALADLGVPLVVTEEPVEGRLAGAEVFTGRPPCSAEEADLAAVRAVAGRMHVFAEGGVFPREAARAAEERARSCTGFTKRLLKDASPTPPIATLGAPASGPGVARLAAFCAGPVDRYHELRDGLDPASSRLSTYLANGSLSARRVWAALSSGPVRSRPPAESQELASRETAGPLAQGPGGDALRRELLWREWFHAVAARLGGRLFAPIPSDRPRLPVRRGRALAFFRGQTGVPIVDAAVTELTTTGWLSNRARQLVASYALFDLGLDARLGALFFERYLVDFDPALTMGNWAYIAGAFGAAHPFDLAWQTARHDPDGRYRARFGAFPERAARIG